MLFEEYSNLISACVDITGTISYHRGKSVTAADMLVRSLSLFWASRDMNSERPDIHTL